MTDQELILHTAAEFDVPPEVLIGPRRFHSLTGPREALARRLRGRGRSLSEIGRLMNRHHSAILSMLAGGKRKG